MEQESTGDTVENSHTKSTSQFHYKQFLHQTGDITKQIVSGGLDDEFYSKRNVSRGTTANQVSARTYQNRLTLIC